MSRPAGSKPVLSLKHLLIGDVPLSHHSRVLECDRCTLSELDVMRRAMFVRMVNAVKPLDCENRIHLFKLEVSVVQNSL